LAIRRRKEKSLQGFAVDGAITRASEKASVVMRSEEEKRADAEREKEECSTVEHALSSRPERSGVEGSAVLSAALPGAGQQILRLRREARLRSG
jgi:hypothetical protein